MLNVSDSNSICHTGTKGGHTTNLGGGCYNHDRFADKEIEDFIESVICAGSHGSGKE